VCKCVSVCKWNVVGQEIKMKTEYNLHELHKNMDMDGNGGMYNEMIN